MKSKKLSLLLFGIAIIVVIMLTRRVVQNDNIVTDPDSGQKVLRDELTILTSGQDINSLITPYKGTIKKMVKETESYQVKFPISGLAQLKEIKSEIEKSGATAMLSIVLTNFEQ